MASISQRTAEPSWTQVQVSPDAEGSAMKKLANLRLAYSDLKVDEYLTAIRDDPYFSICVAHT